MAAADVVSIQLLPPQPRAAPLLVVPTPDPRVNPSIARLAAVVVGGKGEGPEFVWPLTSHPPKVTRPPPPERLMVVGSPAVLLAEFVSLPPETLAVLVTLAAALVATLTVMMIAG